MNWLIAIIALNLLLTLGSEGMMLVTKDGAITLEICRCVGACSQAPVVVVDEESHGRVKPNKFPQIIRPITGEKKPEA